MDGERHRLGHVGHGELAGICGRGIHERSSARVELGSNFFDAAWGCGDGKSESMLGCLVRANPGKRLCTATKVSPKNFEWPSWRE